MNQSEIRTPFERYQNWVVKIAGNENFTTEKKPFKEISEKFQDIQGQFLKIQGNSRIFQVFSKQK